MPQEPDLEILDRWKGFRRHVRDELERHCRCVIGDAHPVVAERRQVREAEEGLELRVGAQLDGYEGAAGALRGDCFVEGGENLSGEGGAGDGADGGAGVVG